MSDPIPELQLKRRISEVLLDSTLSKEQRSQRLAVVCSWFLATTTYDIETAFDYWNSTMADIVEENPRLQAVQ